MAAQPCQLKLFATALESVRTGLALHRQPYAPASLYPVDFAVPGAQGSRCESGCADLLVTVVDASTGKPVSGATVNASSVASQA